jgi:hypothetical protein
MMQIVAELAVILTVGSLLLGIAWYRPGWAIFLSLSAAALLDLLRIGVDGLDVGVSIYIDDVACIIILVTGFLVLIRYPQRFGLDLLPCLALLVLVALSFSRGIGVYGIKAAGNSARNLFIFTSSALAIMLLRPTIRLDASRLARWVAWAGFCLSAIALLRWAGVLPTPVELSDNMREVIRSIPSDSAIVVGQACIAATYLQLVERRGAWWWGAAGIFGVITLALQHRSVWSATSAGLAWLVIRNAARISPVRWFVLGVAIVGALGGIAVAAPQVLGFADSLASANVSEVQQKDSTWAWRVAGYQEAYDRLLASDDVDMLIGPSAGWAANSAGSFASTHIHSRYVDTLAYYGFVGLAILLLWFGTLAKLVGWQSGASRTYRVTGDSSATLLEALLLSEIVYLIAYFGTILQGSMLGLIWVAARQGSLMPAVRWLEFASYPFSRGYKPAAPVNTSV